MPSGEKHSLREMRAFARAACATARRRFHPRTRQQCWVRSGQAVGTAGSPSNVGWSWPTHRRTSSGRQEDGEVCEEGRVSHGLSLPNMADHRVSEACFRDAPICQSREIQGFMPRRCCSAMRNPPNPSDRHPFHPLFQNQGLVRLREPSAFIGSAFLVRRPGPRSLRYGRRDPNRSSPASAVCERHGPDDLPSV